MADTKKTPNNKLHGRLNQNSLKLWFFMGGNRSLVTGLLLTVIFIILVTFGYLNSTVEGLIKSNDSVETLFQALLSSIISGTTIVVSLNQLVLSQELGAVKNQRERMEGAMKFRMDVADVIKADVSPARPAQFIRALIEVAAERAKDLQDAVRNSSDKDFKQEVNNFCSSLIGNAEQVTEGVNNANFGEFDVISSAIDFNYSWKIFTVQRLKKEFDDLLTEDGGKELEKLLEVLNFFGPTREYFKTLYFQMSLIGLSRKILLAAIPAILTSIYMIIFFDFETYTLTIFNIETLVLVISMAATISLLPFLILISYVLRIATITKYTLSIGPFILRETDKVEEVEWDQ